MQLPLYEDAQARLLDGTEDDLDRFIVEHEPGKMVNGNFRKDLADLVAFIETSTKVKCEDRAREILAGQQQRHIWELQDQYDILANRTGDHVWTGAAAGAFVVGVIWFAMLMMGRS